MSKPEVVPSPCVRNCCLNENDICLGCWRSIEEILRWGNADDKEREEILQRVRVRKDNLKSTR